jgi:hypothetical protein
VADADNENSTTLQKRNFVIRATRWSLPPHAYCERTRLERRAVWRFCQVAANIRARIEFHSGAGRSGEGQRLAGAAHGVISNTNPQP